MIVTGNATANECNLTGEAAPVGKFPLLASENVFQKAKRSVLFAGSRVVEVGGASAKARVLFTAGETKKGLLLREMLTGLPMTTALEKEAPYHFCIAITIATVITVFKMYVGNRLFARGLEYGTANGFQLWALDGVLLQVTLFRLLSPVTYSGLRMAALNSSIRLMKNMRVRVLDPVRISLAGQIRVQCFDKTGTITEELLKLEDVVLWGEDELPCDHVSMSGLSDDEGSSGDEGMTTFIRGAEAAEADGGRGGGAVVARGAAVVPNFHRQASPAATLRMTSPRGTPLGAASPTLRNRGSPLASPLARAASPTPTGSSSPTSPVSASSPRLIPVLQLGGACPIRASSAASQAHEAGLDKVDKNSNIQTVFFYYCKFRPFSHIFRGYLVVPRRSNNLLPQTDNIEVNIQEDNEIM